MRKPGGYLLITDPGGQQVEADTFTCCHHNRVVVVKPGSGIERGFCFLCMKPTCRPGEVCTPFERRLEEIEGRDRFQRMMER